MPQNICKFPLSTIQNELFVKSFIFETNEREMKQERILSHNKIILIEQGNGVFSIDGKAFPVQTGTLIFAFKKEKFCLQSDENLRYLYIEFYGGRGNELLRRFYIHPYSRSFENMHGLIPFWKESLSSANDKNLDIASESVLLYSFSRLHANVTPQNDALEKMVKITEARFQDSELSISQIAQELGYNVKYLSHLFKEKMHVTYCEYLRSLRFKYAVILFEHGVNSIKNVAFLSGFSDPLYFSNAFKKELGVSPKKYVELLSRKNGD